MSKILHPIKAVLRPVWHGTRRAWGRTSLQNLEKDESFQARQIAAAIRAAMAGKVAAPTLVNIESERERLRQSKAPLVDGTFPAGREFGSEVTVGEAVGVSVQSVYPAFLYELARNLRATQAIELGTNVGISSSYIGAGLQAGGNPYKLVTLDASPYRQRIAKGIHQKIGLGNVSYITGLFETTLDQGIGELGAVDFAFIDGDHKYQPTLDFFDRLYAVAAEHAVFVFDDIRWTQGMLDAWHVIEKDARVAVAVDFDRMGICVVSKRGGSVPRRYRMWP